jgi:two-component system CheB/CheR fusion protein
MDTTTDLRANGRLAGTRLLLIEDSPRLRQTIRVLLEIEGAVVVETGTGREALDLVRRLPFDLALTDLGLPDMPGRTVIAQIRALTQSRLPVAVLSGAHRDDLAEAVEAGAERAFSKPIDWDALVTYLARRTVPRVA